MCATVVLLALGAFPARPARADFASECSSPTIVVNGSSSQPLNLQVGDVALIASGTFTGGVNSHPQGSTICVAVGATFQPPYINNGAGRLLNNGTTILVGVVSAAGVSVENAGTMSFPAGIGSNGPADVLNLPGGTITVGTGINLNTGVAITNQGTIMVTGQVTFNGGTSLNNSGSISLTGGLLLNGTINNSGQLTVGGSTLVNGGGVLRNSCVLTTTGLTNNGTTANSGRIDLDSGQLLNQGALSQPPTGITLGGSLTNNSQVSGFGQYRFTGTTVTQSSFVGDSAGSPIIFQDTTPSPVPGQIFDTQSGTVANVVTGVVSTVPVDPVGCAHVPPTSTDLAATKTGPATVPAGGTVTYTILLTNAGPSEATDVVLIDDLPPGLTNVTTTPTATITNSQARWTVGTMSPGQQLTFTVTGTAPASGTLLDVVSATTSTPDADAANNDGSLPAARVSTTIQAAPPVNNPPQVADLAVSTVTNVPINDSVTITDPDPGQQVAASVTTDPIHGAVTISPGGVFTYQPAANFTGRDSFVVTACDNGTPSLCDTGTVSITVFPVANPDTATTDADTPVLILVGRNDEGTTSPPVITTPPANGSATVMAARDIRYTPNAGFSGVDTFSYRICSPSDPDVCAAAQVTVTVFAPIQPPEVGDDARTTTANTPVQGSVTLSGGGGTVIAARGTGPSNGTAVVAPDGTYTYTPAPNFTGVDTFTVIGCAQTGARSCATGTVTISVLPVAVDDAATVRAGDSVRIPVRGNDVGEIGPPVVVTPPAHGTVTVKPDGSLVYTPSPGFTGTDTFTYQVCSPNAADLCATATVTVTVKAAPPPRPGPPTPTPTPDLPDTSGPLPDPHGVILTGAGLILCGLVLLVSFRRRRGPTW